jgi:hypothetical protein
MSAFLGDSAVLGELTNGPVSRSGPARVASVGMLLPDLAAAQAGLEKTNVNDSFQIAHAAAYYEALYPFLEPVRRRTGVERPMDRAVERREAEVARAVFDTMSVGRLVSDRDVAALGLRAACRAMSTSPSDRLAILERPDADASLIRRRSRDCD